jgi:hypothetical protein
VEDDRIVSDIMLEHTGGPLSGAFNELWFSSTFGHSSCASCSEGLTIYVRAKVVVEASEEPRQEGNGAVQFEPELRGKSTSLELM